MVIGIHTVHIRVKVPNLLIASNLRELVGGSLGSKGAERPGTAIAHNNTWQTQGKPRLSYVSKMNRSLKN